MKLSASTDLEPVLAYRGTVLGPREPLANTGVASKKRGTGSTWDSLKIFEGLTRDADRAMLNHMVNYSSPRTGTAGLDMTFGALADPTRRAMLARLSHGPASVSELGAPYEMSLPAVSKHVRVLERAGLIARRKIGRTHVCQLLPSSMKTAAEWIETYRSFWDTQLDSLESFLVTRPPKQFANRKSNRGGRKLK
jgi:DNA-binding transcriptional ArsR family regulator